MPFLRCQWQLRKDVAVVMGEVNPVVGPVGTGQKMARPDLSDERGHGALVSLARLVRRHAGQIEPDMTKTPGMGCDRIGEYAKRGQRGLVDAAPPGRMRDLDRRIPRGGQNMLEKIARIRRAEIHLLRAKMDHDGPMGFRSRVENGSKVGQVALAAQLDARSGQMELQSRNRRIAPPAGDFRQRVGHRGSTEMKARKRFG